MSAKSLGGRRGAASGWRVWGHFLQEGGRGWPRARQRGPQGSLQSASAPELKHRGKRVGETGGQTELEPVRHDAGIALGGRRAGGRGEEEAGVGRGAAWLGAAGELHLRL